MPAEFWRMGATPVPVTAIGDHARRMEADGWDGLAVGEAHGLLPDPYVALGLAAAATTTLKGGRAVAVPLRAPLLAASAMATVQSVSGGRARFCLGRGDGAVKVLQQKPMPVARFDEYLRRLQGYLGREEVDIDGIPSAMTRQDDIDPSLGVEKPPVDVAATGPKTLAIAARSADGGSLSVGAGVDRLQNSIHVAHEVCRAEGRDVDDLQLGCY